MKPSNLLEIHPKEPSPFFEYADIPTGDRNTPVLTHITKGGKDNSRIFHTKENGLYHEYRVKNVQKKTIMVMCIYSRRGKVMCKATLILRPKKADLILTTVETAYKIGTINKVKIIVQDDVDDV